MRTLTSGELAKLFNISKYKIRHYLEQEILVPKRNQENGYYYFDEGDIYRLYQIMLYRKIGFSLSEIKASLARESDMTLLVKAESKIEKKLAELFAIQDNIKKITQAQARHQLNEFVMIEREARFYQKIEEDLLVAGELDYQQVIKKELTALDELSYIIKPGEKEVLCFQTESAQADFDFPAGLYGSKSVIAEDKAKLEEEITKFLADPLVIEAMQPKKKILVYENIFCSLAYTDVMVYTIEVEI